jgi:hypothetical protein
MNKNIPSWTGAAALACLMALVAQSLFHKLSRVDLSGQPANDFLAAVAAHRAVFTAEVVAGALSVAFAMTTAASLTGVLKDHSVDELAVAGMFLIAGAVILLVSFAMYGNLVGTGMEFVKGGLAPASAIAQDGDIQGDQVEIIYFLGQVTFSIGLAALGVALVRAGVAPLALGAVSVTVVALAPLMYHLPAAFLLARGGWFGLLAWRAFNPPEAQPIISEAET